MVAGGLVLLGRGAVTGELARSTRPRSPRRAGSGSCTCTLVGSLVGYTTYAWLLRVAPLPLVATYAYVNPVVAVILGAIVLQEPLTPRTIVAGVVIVAAVVLIVTARAGSAAHRRGEPAPSSRPGGRSPPRRAVRLSGRVSRGRLGSTVRATRRAKAIIVIIGLTPSAVGNSEPSPT